jgi:hypothetical protein
MKGDVIFMLTKKKPDKLAGYVFVSERSNMDNRDISKIEVHREHGIFYVSFDACLHSFGVINRNQRMYLADNSWQCITESEKIQSWLADNAWYGEMNHPTQYLKNSELTPQRLQDPAMENRSHKILRPRIEGNLLLSHIETASGTDVGVGFGKEIIQGLRPAFSCRAVAIMQMVNGKPTVIVRRLITYDWVLYPSHKEAHIISDPNLIEYSGMPIKESVGNTEDGFDFTIPLKEFMKETAETDENVNTIMESFNLSFDDLVGFDSKKEHLIIKDNDNRIYVDINPETKHRIDDFFAGF